MAPRSKTEFMLGPSSDVKLTSDTSILFVNLPYMNIHALHSPFSNPPDSDVKLTTEPDSNQTANTMVERFQLPTVPYLPANQLQAVKTGHLLFQILATRHCGRRCIGMSTFRFFCE